MAVRRFPVGEKRGNCEWYLKFQQKEDSMSDKKIEKIYLAVQDIRTLAVRTRPDCADVRDCIECPAIIALPDRLGVACLFDMIRREGKTMKESMRKIFCCECRKPMILMTGPGERNLWRCTTPDCVIHEYTRMKNLYPVH